MNSLIGKVLHATFNKTSVEWDFSVSGKVTVRPLAGPLLGHAPQTIDVNITQIIDPIFLVSWQELNNNTIVLVVDMETKKVWANITTANHKFIQITGVISLQ